MAYVVDNTYFIREFAVPNTDEANSKSLEVLNQYIDDKGRSLLRSALGEVLFAEFDSYLNNGVLPEIPDLPTPDPVPAKWRELVDGVTYTIDSVDYVWGGLVNTVGTYKSSVMVPFIYYYWLKGERSFVSGVGEVRAEAKNAGGVNSTQTLTETWNKFLQMYRGSTLGQLVGNVYRVGIPQYDGYYVGYFGNDTTPSLLQFLWQNDTAYPDAALNTPEPLEGIRNQLGL